MLATIVVCLDNTARVNKVQQWNRFHISNMEPALHGLCSCGNFTQVSLYRVSTIGTRTHGYKTKVAGFSSGHNSHWRSTFWMKSWRVNWSFYQVEAIWLVKIASQDSAKHENCWFNVWLVTKDSFDQPDGLLYLSWSVQVWFSLSLHREHQLSLTKFALHAVCDPEGLESGEYHFYGLQ